MFCWFTVSLGFRKSLVTKFLLLRPTLIDMNPKELHVLEIVLSLSPKTCVSKERKDINIEVFNIITNKDEAKAMTEHISCDCKSKFNSITCSSKKKIE